jgi:hypothetical protein
MLEIFRFKELFDLASSKFGISTPVFSVSFFHEEITPLHSCQFFFKKLQPKGAREKALIFALIKGIEQKTFSDEQVQTQDALKNDLVYRNSIQLTIRNGNQISGRTEHTLGRGEETLGSDKESLGSGEETLGSGEETLGTGEESLGRGEETLGRGEETLGTGEETLGSGEETLGSGEESLGRGEETLGSGEETLGTGEKTLGKGEETLGRGEESLGTGEETLGRGKKTLRNKECIFCKRNNKSKSKKYNKLGDKHDEKKIYPWIFPGKHAIAVSKRQRG